MAVKFQKWHFKWDNIQLNSRVGHHPLCIQGQERETVSRIYLRDFLIRPAMSKVPRAAAPPARAMPIYPSGETT